MDTPVSKDITSKEQVVTAPPTYTAGYDQSYPTSHNNETHITIPVIIQPQQFAQGRWDSDAMSCLNDIPSC